MNNSESEKDVVSSKTTNEVQIERFELADDRFTVEVPTEIRAGSSAGTCFCYLA